MVYSRRTLLKAGGLAGTALLGDFAGVRRAWAQAGATRAAAQIQTQALTIGYEDTGDKQGFPVILLHGFPDDVRAWDDVAPPLQREWFRAHIEIAKQAGKALMIHDRDAHEDVLAILAADGPPERVVFHCFSGDAAMAKRCAAAGYVMSFACTLTFTNAPTLREAAAAAPPDLLLAETDAPFLTPMPHRGKPNTPAMVAHTVRCLAGVKQVGVADMCELVTATGERMFGPW